MIPVTLVCSVCGWTERAQMIGTNGTTPERARLDLARALRWSRDGKLCEYCHGLVRPGRRHRAAVEACA